MTEREVNLREEIGTDEEDIKLLYSLTPENFGKFREMVNAKLEGEPRVVTFCAR